MKEVGTPSPQTLVQTQDALFAYMKLLRALQEGGHSNPEEVAETEIHRIGERIQAFRQELIMGMELLGGCIAVNSWLIKNDPTSGLLKCGDLDLFSSNVTR